MGYVIEECGGIIDGQTVRFKSDIVTATGLPDEANGYYHVSDRMIIKNGNLITEYIDDWSYNPLWNKAGYDKLLGDYNEKNSIRFRSEEETFSVLRGGIDVIDRIFIRERGKPTLFIGINKKELSRATEVFVKYYHQLCRPPQSRRGP